ncbi:MAG: PfkB family carbohydrate kinase [Nitrososphaerales archaeon]
MKDDFLIAGHAVIDQVIDTFDEAPRIALGGPVSYASVALKSLGLTPRIVTRIGYDFPEKYEILLKRLAGIEVSEFKVGNFKTTSYKIDRTYEPRKLWLLSSCKPLEREDFARYIGKLAQPKTLIVDTVANEMSFSLLEQVSSDFDLVAVDSQGFLRKNSDDSEIRLSSGVDLTGFLGGIDILKADMEEIYSWAGSIDGKESLRKVTDKVKILLLTSGAGVVDLYEKGKLRFRVQPFQVDVNDTTGCGDIMLSIFAAEIKKGLKKALAFSVTAATLAAKGKGIEKALLDRSEIENDMRRVEFLRF